MRRTLCLTALALVIVLLPAVAFAAEVREYQLEYSPVTSSGRAFLIVTALLEPEESLPATVSVPVPAGGVVLWAGEILRPEGQDDVERPFTVERVGDMDLYTLTLEESHTAQLDVQMPEPVVEGSRISGSVTWTNPGSRVLVLGSVVVEPDAGDVQTSPETIGEARTNERGESLYPLAGGRPDTGEEYRIDVSWRRGGASLPEEPGVLLPVLLATLAAAVALLAVLSARQRRRARQADSGRQ